jgi:hypothetical protein
VPAQSTVPAGHAHCPFLQRRLPLQISEQRPQWVVSACKFAHVPPHCAKPGAAQRTAHVPSLQKGALGGHRLPQAPQFPLLDVRSTQKPRPLKGPNAHCA